mmetsp:Transcript_1881/g.6340  ORF Transcript_1881/g.6340 Transcript_1881/m.6340 type:complete len:261 (+) Transcript_1881:626-1408(+)
MDEVVGDVRRVVARVRKAREAPAVEVGLQGGKGRHEDVEPHVELLAADQVRILDVALHDVRLRLQILLSSSLRVKALLLLLLLLPSMIAPLARVPLGDLREARKEEDAPALGGADGFHDPHAARPLEFLDEHRVLPRQHETQGGEVVEIRRGPLALRRSLHPLQILHQKILPTQLAAVTEVVQTLRRVEVRRVEDLVHPLTLRPEDVPVEVRLRLDPPAARHDVVNRVAERRTKRDPTLLLGRTTTTTTTTGHLPFFFSL